MSGAGGDAGVISLVFRLSIVRPVG
jgi:hypothetical protein